MATEVKDGTTVQSGIEQKSDKATANKAHGKPFSHYNKTLGLSLPETIEFPFTYTAYTEDAAGQAALVANKDEMTLLEQVKARNVQALNNARSKEREAEFLRRGIVKPTAENDLSIAYKDFLKTFKAVKLPNGQRRFTDEQAMQQAMLASGYDPNAVADDTTDSE